MSLQSFSCPAPIRRRVPFRHRDFALRDLAIQQFESGQHLESLNTIARHVLTELDPALTSLPFSFQHGAVRTELRIKADMLEVTAPLAQLGPDANRVALLRYALTRIAGTGQLFQPRLRDDVLTLEYAEQIAHMHPLKLQEILIKLPYEASNYDQWIVDEFAVAPVLSDSQSSPLSANELQRATAFWRQHWRDMETLHSEVRRKRSARMLDMLGSYACRMPHYILPLLGVLRVDLEDFEEEVCDRDESISKRDTALSRCIREMQAISDETLAASLMHQPYAMNPLQEGSSAMLQSMFGVGDRMQMIHDHQNAGRTIEACLELAAYLSYMVARYSWPEAIDSALRQALLEMDDKPLQETLTQTLNKVTEIAKTWGQTAFSQRALNAQANGDGDSESALTGDFQ